MMTRRPGAASVAALLWPLPAGCVSRPPTIAHVHIGHAVTGVHVTPNKEGYMVTAQRLAQEAIDYLTKARDSNDLSEIKRNIFLVDAAANSKDDFGVKEALLMAVNHISFAATSD